MKRTGHGAPTDGCFYWFSNPSLNNKWMSWWAFDRNDKQKVINKCVLFIIELSFTLNDESVEKIQFIQIFDFQLYRIGCVKVCAYESQIECHADQIKWLFIKSHSLFCFGEGERKRGIECESSTIQHNL